MAVALTKPVTGTTAVWGLLAVVTAVLAGGCTVMRAGPANKKRE